MAVLESMAGPVRAAVDDAKKRINEALEGKPYEDDMGDRSYKLFDEIYKKLDTCNNVATLQNIKVEADALKVRLLNEIDARDRQLAVEAAAKQKAEAAPDAKTPPQAPAPKIKKRKNISIQTINVSSSWQIETPQDVDKYVNELRKKILSELSDDTVINIEF